MAIFTSSCERNWNNLTSYFDLSIETFSILYTTTPSKISIEVSVSKKQNLVYGEFFGLTNRLSAVIKIENKWSMPLHNSGLVLH